MREEGNEFKRPWAGPALGLSVGHLGPGSQFSVGSHLLWTALSPPKPSCPRLWEAVRGGRGKVAEKNSAVVRWAELGGGYRVERARGGGLSEPGRPGSPLQLPPLRPPKVRARSSSSSDLASAFLSGGEGEGEQPLGPGALRAGGRSLAHFLGHVFFFFRGLQVTHTHPLTD